MNRTALPHKAHAQQGATLIITLVMLVIITLVSLSTMRSAAVDEKIAGNSRDRNKAFQAAEAAVQTCLTQVQDGSFTGTVQTPTTAPDAPVWEDANSWTTTISSEVDLGDDAGLAAQPRCIVENLGGTSRRVTGRAVGGSADSVVILQATYTTE
jgi:type IV pilus assembly protein PilX